MEKGHDRDNDVQITELLRTSQSWDGAEMPDYPIGRPELVAIRYEFPPGKKLGWHHHDVMNYGVVQQGELTIITLDGKEKTVHEGGAVVEMVGTIHHGENRGNVTVVLDMFYSRPASLKSPSRCSVVQDASRRGRKWSQDCAAA